MRNAGFFHLSALKFIQGHLVRLIVRPGTAHVRQTQWRAKSTLSAIHRGLHRSGELRRGGAPGSKIAQAIGSTNGATDLREQPLRRPTFRIRKGKKDITEKPGPRPKSRRARFFDPSDHHGKQSLVYQFKTGRLKEELRKTLRDQQAAEGGRPFGSRSQPRSLRRSDDQLHSTERVRATSALRTERPRNVPLSLPYSTAASQFLYGRSVVKAALETSRRQFYKLYLYDGRTDKTDSRTIEELAKKKGIEIKMMDEEGRRLMDKMSESRPHNGVVLEASPVPQLPVTHLGPVIAATPDSPGGFEVAVGHQLPEEAAINGSSDIVAASSPRRQPFVVLLDQTMDVGNLGSIIRSAGFFGADAVAVTKRSTTSLTAVAVKASSGAAEAVTLLSVDHISNFLTESRRNGWKVYAAVPSTPVHRRMRKMTVAELDSHDPLSNHPCILLLGTEGPGLSRMLANMADFEVNIPRQSASEVVDSLNVGVAAGILFAAFLKERPGTQAPKLW